MTSSLSLSSLENNGSFSPLLNATAELLSATTELLNATAEQLNATAAEHLGGDHPAVGISDSHVWIASVGLLSVALLFGVLRGTPSAPKGGAGFSRALITHSEIALSDCRRRASAEETLGSLRAHSEDRVRTGDSRLCCGIPFTENMSVLALTAALFAIITILQALAARIAKSDALLADCASMAVDALTYLLNIFVEAREGKAFHRELQIIAPTISLSMLAYFTVSMLLEAKETLFAKAGTEADDDVNPTIIMGFAILGIVFDAIALRAFLKDADKGSMNMFAAFAHVGADFLRSTVTLVAAILIMRGYDGIRTDAWACVAVTGLIFAGILFAIYELAKDMRAYVSRRRTTLSDESSIRLIDLSSYSEG